MSKKAHPIGANPHIMCALTPGTLGIADAASPDTPSWFLGDTPGTLGCQDHADPRFADRVHLIDVHLRTHPPISPTPDLSNVSAAMLAEYDVGLTGGQFATQLVGNVTWAAQQSGLNPGFLASVLLSEKDKPWYYVCPAGTVLHDPDSDNPDKIPGVNSYIVGTDHYAGERARIEATVPAARQVNIQPRKGREHLNDAITPHNVEDLFFVSGRDAVLGVAVYLKYGEYLVRRRLRSFDAQPIAVQWGLTRLAMNPGIGAAESRIAKVRQGQNIFVHRKIVRDPGKADSAMTRVVAIAFHLSQTFFGIEP